MAYVPGSGLVSAAVADLIIGVLNRYTGQAYPAPALVALECDVLRWMVGLFRLPATAAGLLTSGASLATFSGLVAARVARLGDDFARGTLYTTSQTHHAVAKAARLAGFPPAAVRVVAVDRELRLDVAALRSMVERDRRAGRRPFCVVATAGTTSTGAIDPLPAVADVAAGEGLWLHVDAAYGGFFALTDRGRARLAGIERADSIVLDPHKSLFLPFGTGALLVREGESLRRSHGGEQREYLQDAQDRGLPDFSDYGPELTREARGVRLWFALNLHGVAAFRSALDEKLDLAELAFDELSADPGFELLARPELSIVTFRIAGADPGSPTRPPPRCSAGSTRSSGYCCRAPASTAGTWAGSPCSTIAATDRACWRPPTDCAGMPPRSDRSTGAGDGGSVPNHHGPTWHNVLPPGNPEGRAHYGSGLRSVSADRGGSADPAP